MDKELTKKGPAEKGLADKQIALKDLTRTQRTVLASLRDRPLWRVHNGWRPQGAGPQVSLATGTVLLRLRLVEQTSGSLRLTPLGRLLAEEAQQAAQSHANEAAGRKPSART